YLSAEQRADAPSLYRALNVLRDALADGATKTQAVDRAQVVLAPSAAPDYFDVVDAFTFEPKERLEPNTFVIGAVRFGSTRLLDNLYVAP
ncbi:MAG TPA: pantoate--beta-alanine ligase, partial [Candidatus Baltobacteraceae bacterium]|nr:pantoate--beta-alanine ligase [Candidatus Baltobacteraceae bacterium]